MPAVIAPNALVGNRYRVICPLGGGGMKQVYLAHDTRLANRPCALAEMIDSFADPKDRQTAAAAFHREADMLAGLAHNRIVRIYDKFSEGNRHFLVMEYVEGETLEDRLKAAGGKLDESATIDVALQVLDALEYLHSCTPPVIYRDLKPSNLIVSADGRVKMVDFGIARFFQPQATATMVGTQGYAPPEQYKGKAEARSDLYALGATMHFMLTGRDPALEPPFMFPPVQQLCAGCSPTLVDLITEALALDLKDRVPSAADFRRRLMRLKNPTATSIASPRSPRPTASSAPTVAALDAPLCAHCAKPIPADARFCPYCSADLSVAPQPPARERTGVAARAALLAGGILALFALAFTGVYYYQQYQGEQQRVAAARDQPLQASAGTFRDCDGCPEMVVVPAGSFTMGSPSSEPKRSPGEGPQHRVTIGQAFAVGKYPVTRDEYSRFASETGRDHENPGFPQTGRHPAVLVSWDDAKAYVAWLSQKTGHSYRLLSESEYEYAERAGTTTAYWWGDSDADLCGYANGGPCNHHGTVPVGSYPANAFGLYDMAGNVWEYTEDCWNESYAGAPDDGTAWTTGTCIVRVVRGGSRYSGAGYLRSAFRYALGAGSGDAEGFRVARTL